MKAIVTKYLPAGSFRGSRIKATAEGVKSLTLHYDDSLNSDWNHRRAAELLCERQRWTGNLCGGALPNGGMAWTFQSECKPREKGWTKNPGRKGQKRTRKTKRAKQNPKTLADRTAEASGRFKVLIGSAIFARKGSGPRMHFDGRKFTTNGKPKFFRSHDSAVHVARDLVATHGRILKDYAVTVEGASQRGKA